MENHCSSNVCGLLGLAGEEWGNYENSCVTTCALIKHETQIYPAMATNIIHCVHVVSIE